MNTTTFEHRYEIGEEVAIECERYNECVVKISGFMVSKEELGYMAIGENNNLLIFKESEILF